jgi:hypothetical protein
VITEEPQCARTFSIDIAVARTKNKQAILLDVLSAANSPFVVGNGSKQGNLYSLERFRFISPDVDRLMFDRSVRTSGRFHVFFRTPAPIGDLDVDHKLSFRK